MNKATLQRILENDQSRFIVSKILEVMTDHNLNIGEARNVLAAADCMLNMSTVTAIKLPGQESLTETRNGRVYFASIFDDILLRDDRDVP